MGGAGSARLLPPLPLPLQLLTSLSASYTLDERLGSKRPKPGPGPPALPRGLACPPTSRWQGLPDTRRYSAGQGALQDL